MTQHNSQPQPDRQQSFGDVQLTGEGSIFNAIQGNGNTIYQIKQCLTSAELQDSVRANDAKEVDRKQSLWIISQKIIKNQLTFFVARPSELKQVVNSLLDSRERPSSNITALWGAGGCGKTALALVVCYIEKIVKHFTGGIFWIDLGEGKDILEGVKLLHEQSTGLKPPSNTVDDIAIEIRKKSTNRN